MSATLKSRLQKMEDPLMAAVCVRQAEWLQDLPEEEKGAGVLEIAFDGDVDKLKQAEPAFRDMPDEQISEVLGRRARDYVQHLRNIAKDLRGQRR